MSDLPAEVVCADCGRKLTLWRGRWADTDLPGKQVTWRFTCRENFDVKSDRTRRLESADYHHLAGQPQRHWGLPDECE